jgi:hypothetical protein
VKDSDGNTGGANVNDPNSSGVIQILFPAGTDLECGGGTWVVTDNHGLRCTTAVLRTMEPISKVVQYVEECDVPVMLDELHETVS